MKLNENLKNDQNGQQEQSYTYDLGGAADQPTDSRGFGTSIKIGSYSGVVRISFWSDILLSTLCRHRRWELGHPTFGDVINCCVVQDALREHPVLRTNIKYVGIYVVSYVQRDSIVCCADGVTLFYKVLQNDLLEMKWWLI